MKSLEAIPLNTYSYLLKTYFVQDFFFQDSQRVKFDVRKLTLFCILYCGGTEFEKVTFLFNLVETLNSGAVKPTSKIIVKIFQNLI